MECILYKIQYFQKPKTNFNLELDHHKKDFNNTKAISACHHLKIYGHNFMKYAKFTLIEQLTEISIAIKDKQRLRLERSIDR